MSGTIDPGTNVGEEDSLTRAIYDVFVAELGEPVSEETQDVWRKIATSFAQGLINNLVSQLSNGSTLQIDDGALIGGNSGGSGDTITLSGVIEDSLGETENNYVPPSPWPTANWLRLEGLDGTLSGISATDVPHGALFRLTCAANTLTLLDSDAGSSAGNRFLCPGGLDVQMSLGTTVSILRDNTLNRWLVMGVP